MKLDRIKTAAAIWTCIPLLALAASCREPGYRVEVQAGQQGQTELKRIPYTPEERAALEQKAKAEQVAAAAMKEPDFAEIQSLWPKLSIAQRAELIESAKRMTR